MLFSVPVATIEGKLYNVVLSNVMVFDAIYLEIAT